MEDKMEAVLKDSKLVPAVVGLLAFGAGVGLGYILGRRTKYEVIKLGDRPSSSRPPRVVVDAKELAKDVKNTPTPMKTLRIEPVHEEDEEPVTLNEAPVETTNVFASTVIEEDNWDLDKEIRHRNPLEPYVIHRDEFFAEEMSTEDYIQSTLTYYAGDDTLVDEDEKPIYNHESVVGSLKFGHGSNDPNVVYVRNMTRQCEYEIVRDPGHYRIEVLGMEMEEEEKTKELKHAKIRKFRQE